VEHLLRYLWPRAPYRCQECGRRSWQFVSPLRGTLAKTVAATAVLGVVLYVTALVVIDSEIYQPPLHQARRTPPHREARTPTRLADAGKEHPPHPAVKPSVPAERAFHRNAAKPSVLGDDLFDEIRPRPSPQQSDNTVVPQPPAGVKPAPVPTPVAVAPVAAQEASRPKPNAAEEVASPPAPKSSQPQPASSPTPEAALPMPRAATASRDQEHTHPMPGSAAPREMPAPPPPPVSPASTSSMAPLPPKPAERAPVSTAMLHPKAEAPRKPPDQAPNQVKATQEGAQVRARAPQTDGVQRFRGVQSSSQKGGVQVSLLTDRPVKAYKSFFLQDPPRFVIDLDGEWQTRRWSDIRVNSDVVKNIRIGRHPDRLRIVMDLKTDQVPSSKFSDSPEGLVVTLQSK
jgi:hypothetical protein